MLHQCQLDQQAWRLHIAQVLFLLPEILSNKKSPTRLTEQPNQTMRQATIHPCPTRNRNHDALELT